MTKSEKSGIIEINKDKLHALMEKLETDTLLKSDYLELKSFLLSLSYLIQILEEKDLSIMRLKKVFRIKTEKSRNILTSKNEVDSASLSGEGRVEKADQVVEAGCEREVTGEAANLDNDMESGISSAPKKGHGRNGASAYTGLSRVKLCHEKLKAGDKCPDCPNGRLYKIKKSLVSVLITGNAPLEGVIYERELLRCSSCQTIFKPDLPSGMSTEKYDEKAQAIVSLLKYGYGMPFNRLENLQGCVGVPMPASTQWELVEHVGNTARNIYVHMIYKAAQAELFYHDDTRIKILCMADEKDNEKSGGAGKDDEAVDTDTDIDDMEPLPLRDPKLESVPSQRPNPGAKRKGTFTTGVVAEIGKKKIALYFSGRNHSGENMEKILRKRSQGLAPPLRMCDAEARNTPKGVDSIPINCLVHGRRNFVELVEVFPCESRFVVEALAKVYRNDRMTKAYEMSGDERLSYHQRESGPVMVKVKKWIDDQLEERKAEPNSSLGRAIQYMQRNWEKLTAFLRIENAPLDNNVAERILKNAILNRKNAYFYKTVKGAEIGDILMSIIQTCKLAKVNLFEYLVAIQRYADMVIKNPAQWFPWNYLRTIAKQNNPGP